MDVHGLGCSLSISSYFLWGLEMFGASDLYSNPHALKFSLQDIIRVDNKRDMMLIPKPLNPNRTRLPNQRSRTLKTGDL